MKRSTLVTELREVEKRIAELNDAFQFGRGLRPSEADPEVCARRKFLRKLLVERTYEDG